MIDVVCSAWGIGFQNIDSNVLWLQDGFYYFHYWLKFPPLDFMLYRLQEDPNVLTRERLELWYWRVQFAIPCLGLAHDFRGAAQLWPVIWSLLEHSRPLFESPSDFLDQVVCLLALDLDDSAARCLYMFSSGCLIFLPGCWLYLILV